MKEMTHVDLAAGLRSRLLYTSIGLAIVVSIIFISVAFNLSTDLGESLEAEHSHYQRDQLKNHIKSLLSKNKKNSFILNENDKTALLTILDEDIVGAEFWFDLQRTQLKKHALYAQNNEISQAIKTNESSEGFFEKEDIRLFWSYQYYPTDNFSLLIGNYSA